MAHIVPPTEGVKTPPTTYSPARVGVTKYTIYPTGYEQSPFSDSDHFCIFVEQYPDTGRWRVYDGFRHGQIVTHKGTWTRDRPQVRHLTRFDTAEEAIKVALVAVDTRPFRNLVEWIEGPRGQKIIRGGGA